VKKLLIAAACISAFASVALADVETNKDSVKSALTGAFAEHDVAAVDKYFADPYIQHNPIAPSGIAHLRGLIEQLSKGPKGGVEIHRIIGEGDLVASHTTYTGFGPVPLVAFDIFRFNKDGKIVEHWDNLAPVAEPNVSGHTQTDGATQIVDRDKTDANKALVEDFISRVLIKGEQVDFTKFISPTTYIQHNSSAGDGLEGLGAFMQYLAENKIDFYYKELHLLVAEGNFVMAASEGVFGDTPTAYFDLFRLEDDLIVEHWDVIADMPSGDLPAGYPGKF